MSFKSKKQAQTHCDTVLTILDPKCEGTWTGRVWNNLGWHCAWQQGSVSLYYSSYNKSYSVLIGDPGTWAGRPDLCQDSDSDSDSDSDNCKDPKEAVRQACEAALEIIEKEWKPIQLSITEVLEGIG